MEDDALRERSDGFAAERRLITAERQQRALRRRSGPARRAGSTIGKMLLLLGCAVLAGVVVAGLALPAAALAGLTSKSAATSFDSLPSSLRVPPVAQTSNLYANDGKTLITSFYEEHRLDVHAAEVVAKVMRQAIVAAEDAGFYQPPRGGPARACSAPSSPTSARRRPTRAPPR